MLGSGWGKMETMYGVMLQASSSFSVCVTMCVYVHDRWIPRALCPYGLVQSNALGPTLKIDVLKLSSCNNTHTNIRTDGGNIIIKTHKIKKSDTVQCCYC